MNGSFWNAVTGAKSHQTAIDATGNNIANINTTGYRASRTEFANLFSETLNVNQQTLSSDKGMGTRVQATATDMRAGTYQSTDNTFDVALSGNGWFVVLGTNPYDAKQVAYTRDGAFSRDRDSFLVSQSGNYVLGSTYGNLIEENGMWRIDPSVQTGGLQALGAQGPLRVPSDITFPPVATSEATLNANLSGQETLQIERDQRDRDLSALLDRNGAAMEIRPGEGVLIAAGEEQAFYGDGGIRMERTLTGGIEGPFSVVINGQLVEADWEAGADGAAIASAIAAAANALEGVSAQSTGDRLTIGAGQSLQISQSSEPGLMGSLSADVIRYQKGGVETLSDLARAIETTVQRRHETAQLHHLSDGSLNLKAQERVDLQIGAIDNTNSNLLAALSPLTLGAGSSLRSEPFNQTVLKTSQHAVSPDGKRLEIETNLTLSRQASESEPALWEASAQLVRQVSATNQSDLSNLYFRDAPLDLKGGEDVWFNAGKPAAGIDDRRGYSLKLADDSPNGTDAQVSFTLGDQAFSVTAPDGSDLATIASAISSELEAAGYASQRSGSELIIFPREGEPLHFSQGQTNLANLTYEDMSLGRITYSPGMSLEAFKDEISAIGAPLGVSAVLENGALALQNSRETRTSASLLSGENTPENFQNLFARLNGALEAGARQDPITFSAREILSQSGPQTVRFGADGRLAEGESLTLNNGGTPLAIKMDLTQWAEVEGFADLQQNGAFEGGLKAYDINREGQIVGSFSNGQSSVIGQLAVYHFRNDQGLMRTGENHFMQSENSGEPFFWVDETGAYVPGALVQGRTLEGSNVQSAKALTELIVYQRSYEGSAKAITTSDELVQGAIQMKR